MSRAAAIEHLLAWARARGARCDGLAIHVDAHDRASARAARAIAPGEPLIVLPRHLMIVDDDLAPGTTTPRDVLAAWLPIAARDPASPWRPYLDVLPAALPELPMLRTAGDLAHLAGTGAHAMALEARRELHACHPPHLAFADWAWGCAIVQSRGYHAPGTFEHHIALYPIVDLLDHGLGDATWSFDPRDAELVVSADRAIAAGEPVHFPYGERGNAWLFVHHGFTLPDNPHDEAMLRLDSGATVFVARGAEAELDAEHVAAAHRARAALDAPAPPPTADPTWDRACAHVRAGERAVLDHLINHLIGGGPRATPTG